MYCLVPFLYTHNPITDELVPPCSKVGIIFACEVHMLCIFECPHHLWWRCQAGTYSLVIHLPHWQSPRHPPCLHWPHLQKGLRHFHLMLLRSGQIPRIRWPGDHAGDLPWDPPPLPDPEPEADMSLMSLRNFILIHDLTRNPSQKKRKNWTTSDMEREI